MDRTIVDDAWIDYFLAAEALVVFEAFVVFEALAVLRLRRVFPDFAGAGSLLGSN